MAEGEDAIESVEDSGEGLWNQSCCRVSVDVSEGAAGRFVSRPLPMPSGTASFPFRAASGNGFQSPKSKSAALSCLLKIKLYRGVKKVRFARYVPQQKNQLLEKNR